MLDNKDKTYDEICKFVRKKPGRTINQIVTHIVDVKKLCAKQTAQDRVNDLIGNRLVDNRKGSPKGFHNIHINDKDQFNLIDKELTEIENCISMMNKPMDKIKQLRLAELYIGSKEFSDLRDYFEFPYRNSFSTIFLLLLIRANDKIHSDNDLKILYERIFELMIKLNLQTFDLGDTKNILNSLVHNLERLQQSSSLEAYAEKYDVNIKLGNNIITKIRNFEKRFLN